ncbi:MAG TPA: alpha/beta hydrolase [Casimicrobiaceae bacterium]|nr:alpha/beta hydrolase [Casimicrobiaceae bacterium]
MEWIIVLVVIVLGVFAAAWLGQEGMIFFPQPVAANARLPARASALEIVGGDGTRLRGWIVPGAAAPAPTVIYFGGNAEEVSWALSDARWPREWTIVGVNYRGYGTSEGKPGEAALKADAPSIYDAIANREDVDAQRIVVFGRSLGTGVAVYVAAERPVARVVLASPYDSFVALGRRHYPWLPVSLLLRHRFDAAADAKRCRMPLLAIVGEYDTIIPADRSRALYDAWAGPKRWLSVPGADHNDLGDAEAFWAGVARFLEERA